MAGGPQPWVRVPPAASVLLERAHQALDDADAARSADERFCSAHLGALRAAAAVVAARGRPAASRRRLVSVWVLLDALVPELRDWSSYFAAGAQTRADVEAGRRQAVSTRVADEQVRAATEFCRVVEASLGLLPLARAS